MNIVLCVIDGWGCTEDKHGNAIKQAATPTMNQLSSANSVQLAAHGEHVGLVDGLMGNSEVGHLNIGAGRVIYQDILRINRSVRNQFSDNELIGNVCNGNGRLHLAGLVSDGGVHSHIQHLKGLLLAFKKVPKVFVHFFGDGRDTSPTSATGYLQQLLDFMQDQQCGELGTIVGRYYAMDRDKRWDRIKVAYEALVGGVGEQCVLTNAVKKITERYAAGQTDEFLEPICFSKEATVQDNDTLVFFNYRADRMRQLAACMGGLQNLEGTNIALPRGLRIYTMTQYKKEFPFPILFPPVTHKNVLAEWLSVKGVKQFHCAETEKYAHVTFFFNGGREEPFADEERDLVPSPKVATYDLEPAMNCSGVADMVIEKITRAEHPFIMCNFAAPDMVGHTGEFGPAVIACEATDTAIGRIFEACKKHGYVLLVTSDHGNAEKMIAEDGGKHTAHTCNKVPFTCSSNKHAFKKMPPTNADGTPRDAALRDVAPTVLYLLGLPAPLEMDGANLLEATDNN
ncbi:2,3-bisphosphoglycerate-independent phosphoglycerate mutase [Globodera pallida]|nr:2,3-bisphosphoglycerate-independent phosphoglycerate mutase [Globodera pallida]